MPNRSEPYFGLSISRVDPLPHQLEAVYEHLLKLPRVRFLLADDAGAGKTIMAGLLIRELKLRGLIERVLVVCPANLTFQWQRELNEKFDEKFLVFKGSDIRDQFGVNQWLEQKLDNEHEAARGCQVYDVREKNLGYDVTSLDLQSGELRLIRGKGARRPDRQHPPYPQRTPRGRGPARLLLAVRGHRLCNRPESPAADPGLRQVPVARGHQAATDGDTGDGTRLQCGAQTMSEQVLDQAVLDEIIRRIVAVARPEKIILFGSVARGQMGRHSDVDLLIVKNGPDRRRTATTIYRHLHGVDAAVDVIVVTPDDVERYRDSHALIINPALREGRVVYESS